MSVRPWRCSTSSVLSVSSTLSKIGALVCGGGPFKRDVMELPVVSLLCTERSRVSVCSRAHFDHRGSRYDVLFFEEPHFTADCDIACVTAPKSGICSCNVGSLLGIFTAPVHWMRTACSHGVFPPLKTRQHCLEDLFLPPAHRLSPLPPSILCFCTCSQARKFVINGVSHCPHTPSHVKLQLFSWSLSTCDSAALPKLGSPSPQTSHQ